MHGRKNIKKHQVSMYSESLKFKKYLSFQSICPSLNHYPTDLSLINLTSSRVCSQLINSGLMNVQGSKRSLYFTELKRNYKHFVRNLISQDQSTGLVIIGAENVGQIHKLLSKHIFITLRFVLLIQLLRIYTQFLQYFNFKYLQDIK